MAIETRIVNNSFTEIYVGGNFITQSYPTNFHQFYTRKILTASESIEDFKEITEAEKLALEKSDAEWERPPQSFIDEWESVCYEPINNLHFGQYNENTGYFEYGDVKDLTYKDAVDSLLMCIKSDSDYANHYYNKFVRVAMCAKRQPYGNGPSLNAFAFNSQKLEYIRLSTNNYQATSYSNFTGGTFSDCRVLRIIEPVIGFSNYTEGTSWDLHSAFYRCYALENIMIHSLRTNLTIKDSPMLSLDSIKYMIENRSGTIGITITLHPDAYARVTDELFALAAEKNITIATP